MIETGPEAQVSQQFDRPGLGFGPRQSTDHLRQQDVLKRGKLRQQMVGLVDETDLVAADAGTLMIGQDRSRAAVDIDIAMIGMLEQASYVEQSRLPGA